MNGNPISKNLYRMFRNLSRLAMATLLLSGATAQESKHEGENETDQASRKNPALKEVVDVPGLPRVLIIGDSISIGYTKQVREALKGKANVHRIPGNGQSTLAGLKEITAWLGTEPWDVVHFNFGLHDAKYQPDGKPKVSREDYVKNLQEILKSIKTKSKTVVWGSTTPVPEKLLPEGRRFDSIPERNELARKLMTENGVPITDLYAVILPVQTGAQRPNDVHFTPEGYKLLGEAVTASITPLLGKPESAPNP